MLEEATMLQRAPSFMWRSIRHKVWKEGGHLAVHNKEKKRKNNKLWTDETQKCISAFTNVCMGLHESRSYSRRAPSQREVSTTATSATRRRHSGSRGNSPSPLLGELCGFCTDTMFLSASASTSSMYTSELLVRNLHNIYWKLNSCKVTQGHLKKIYKT